MRTALLLAAATIIAGCIDFSDGLACATDADCLGYVCVEGSCLPPADASVSFGAGSVPTTPRVALRRAPGSRQSENLLASRASAIASHAQEDRWSH